MMAVKLTRFEGSFRTSQKRGSFSSISARTDDTVIGNSRPSRRTKRRKCIPPLRRSEECQQFIGHDEQPSSYDDSDRLISRVSQNLKSRPVQAAKNHANAIHEAVGDGVKAYAKVAAQDWTFFITKLAVNIGRTPEVIQSWVHDRIEPETNASCEPYEDNRKLSSVHIDLGPCKMISREHASITFDSELESWLFSVKGRNGARIDGQSMEPCITHRLTSGQVIEIGNVEMMFVLPLEISPLRIHPMFLRRCPAGSSSPRPTQTPCLLQSVPARSKYTQKKTPVSQQQFGDTWCPTERSLSKQLGLRSLDLSCDENRHIKPQFSYAQMIAQAIMHTSDGKLNLSSIYNFITDNYSYYRHQHAAGWQNSIRHNLSLNKSFSKVARSSDEPGKGMKWQIVSEAREEMTRNAYRIGRGGHRGPLPSSSPSQCSHPSLMSKDLTFECSSSIRQRQNSPTVTSGNKQSHTTPKSTQAMNIATVHTLVSDVSPTKKENQDMITVNVTDIGLLERTPRSPILPSRYCHDNDTSFTTPAPPRVHPRLIPPSTAQRPSQHMPTSSPALFWKFADVGSTPLRRSKLPNTSPPKADLDDVWGISSPPMVKVGYVSTLGKVQDADYTGGNCENDERNELPCFDLTRGFQSIGRYHAIQRDDDPLEKRTIQEAALNEGPSDFILN